MGAPKKHKNTVLGVEPAYTKNNVDTVPAMPSLTSYTLGVPDKVIFS